MKKKTKFLLIPTLILGAVVTFLGAWIMLFSGWVNPINYAIDEPVDLEIISGDLVQKKLSQELNKKNKVKCKIKRIPGKLEWYIYDFLEVTKNEKPLWRIKFKEGTLIKSWDMAVSSQYMKYSISREGEELIRYRFPYEGKERGLLFFLNQNAEEWTVHFEGNNNTGIEKLIFSKKFSQHKKNINKFINKISTNKKNEILWEKFRKKYYNVTTQDPARICVNFLVLSEN